MDPTPAPHSSDAVRIEAVPKLGLCLISTRHIKAGEVVLSEAPLLLATAPLPPLAAFAPLDPVEPPLLPEPSGDDPAEFDVVGGGLPEKGPGAWPTKSTFDPAHLGLLLAFAGAPAAVRARVVTQMQGVVEPFGGSGPGACEGVPREAAAAVCCAQAAEQLARRGGPWDVEKWELESEVLAACPAANLLERLLVIFTVNAHTCMGGAALFDLGTKLAHSCGQVDVEYSACGDRERPRGVFTAIRDVPAGRVLTMSYLRPSARQCSTPQRRRILYCQKGFLCRCYACAAVADPYRCGREDAVRDGAAAGWLTHAHLQEERALSGEAASLSHIFERGAGPPPKASEREERRMRALASRAADLLGDGHFATQAFRRVLLAQGAATRRWTEAEQSQADGCLRYLSSRAAAVAGAEPGANLRLAGG